MKLCAMARITIKVLTAAAQIKMIAPSLLQAVQHCILWSRIHQPQRLWRYITQGDSVPIRACLTNQPNHTINKSINQINHINPLHQTTSDPLSMSPTNQSNQSNQSNQWNQSNQSSNHKMESMNPSNQSNPSTQSNQWSNHINQPMLVHVHCGVCVCACIFLPQQHACHWVTVWLSSNIPCYRMHNTGPRCHVLLHSSASWLATCQSKRWQELVCLDLNHLTSYWCA